MQELIRLEGVSEPVDVVTSVLVLGSLGLGPGVVTSGVPGILLLVLVAQVPGHESARYDDEHTIGYVDGVALEVSRLVDSGVDEGTDDTAGVTDGDDDSGSNTLLERATTVVRTPRDDDRDKRVDTGSSQEHADVVDPGNLGSNQESEAEGADGGKDHRDDASLLETI